MSVRIALTEPQWISLTSFFEEIYGDEAADWDYYSLTHLQVWKRWFRQHNIVYKENIENKDETELQTWNELFGIAGKDTTKDGYWGIIKFHSKKQITFFLLQYPELGFIFDHNHNHNRE